MNFEKKSDLNVCVGLKKLFKSYDYYSNSLNYFSAGIGYNLVFLDSNQFPFIGFGINVNKKINNNPYYNYFKNIYFNGKINVGGGLNISDNFVIRFSMQYEFGLTTLYSYSYNYKTGIYPFEPSDGRSEKFKGHEFLFQIGVFFKL